ncbi:hypothetical protein [Rufibacter quisquiliarum]|uniref:Uncharacterized protein n=1 Tax=Rufibacter quisquiliarum TaxID=1549639 RepID=A0A839GNA0_9BACT|nr:hypothetical protein [Rufibacter quisquiliarum]MBA9078289.1 hypothetical protein [Rufibacter quisquiliarum]
MNAQIIQKPGPTWTLNAEIPAFTEKELDTFVKQGLAAATSKLVEQLITDAVRAAACVKVSKAARLLDIQTVETVRGYGKLPPKHPKYLPIIPGESAVMDKVRLTDLIAWCERNSQPGAKDKITAFEAKTAKH